MEYPRIHNRVTLADHFVSAAAGLGLFLFVFTMFIALLGWPA